MELDTESQLYRAFLGFVFLPQNPILVCRSWALMALFPGQILPWRHPEPRPEGGKQKQPRPCCGAGALGNDVELALAPTTMIHDRI